MCEKQPFLKINKLKTKQKAFYRKQLVSVQRKWVCANCLTPLPLPLPLLHLSGFPSLPQALAYPSRGSAQAFGDTKRRRGGQIEKALDYVPSSSFRLSFGLREIIIEADCLAEP